ncbi:putative phospholipase, SCC2/Nipped-B family [Lupinus albus]|uniref:Putative phospholipase, SCC2/Nipped-B family n=1 Tax=Lupinus albus TaxID=3870 RepID=A0A6A4QD98_LUPAL|nr:putative phospholipase, SCC2/Nipped-B family [Lupinus albus]
MSQKQRVMATCVYASNPYHECTEFCFQKIKETKSSKTKKSTDYRRSVTDGELGKKMNGEKHTQSGTLSLARRKKEGSKPELPVLDSIPASKIGAIYLSDASSPLSNYSEEKNVGSKRSEKIPVSGEIYLQDIKPVNHKVQPNKDGAEYVAANPIGTKHEEDKNSSTKVVPITNVDNTGGLTTSAGGSIEFNFSNLPHDNEDSDGDESEYVVSESRVLVGSYHVKESFASILRSIFDKYGDIGANCHLESVVMRSYYIECVCFVVQELQSTSIVHITKSKVKELLAILKDVETAEINVAWLRSVLDKIAENIDLINQHRAAEVAKANSDHEIEQLRNKMGSELETLAQKEQEVTDTKTRIEEIKKRMSELEVKTSYLDKNMLYIKSKVDNLGSKTMLDELS